jgi:hypothetical protein
MSDQTFDVDPAKRRPRKDHVNSGRPNGVKRFLKGEREDAIRQVSRLLKPFVQPSEVVRHIVGTWGVSTRAAWTLLKDARSYLCARWGMSKDYLRCELVDYLAVLTGDQTASVAERVGAVNAIAKMLGLFAPDRSVTANVGADADPATARDVLQQMHADLLNNPEAVEAAHKLYECMGLPSGVPSLEERMARNQAEAAALLEEYRVRQGGRLPNGLKELPPETKHNGEQGKAGADS